MKFSVPFPMQGLPPELVGWKSILEEGFPVRTETAAYTANTLDFLILADATAGAFTVTLPPAADAKGKLLFIQRTSASNNVTIDADGSETINGSATVTLSSQYASRLLISTGSAWAVLASV